MSILSAYANAAVNTAARVQQKITQLELGIGHKANIMSDCCELQELANRLYSLLYRRGETLPDQMDPLTMRFRELGESNPGEAGMAPRMETPSRKAADDAITTRET